MNRATFLKRHTLWVGFATVLLPLAVLLAVQYRWLVQLGEKSAQVHRAALGNCLEAVTDKVQNFYIAGAERTLNVPPAAFTPGNYAMIARHFGAKGTEGASRLFVVIFDRLAHKESILFYERPACRLYSPDWDFENATELRAVSVATAPLRLLVQKGGKIKAATLASSQLDGRMVLTYPVTDDTWQVVGLAGMILDPVYFKDELLPKVIGAVVPHYSPGYGADDLVVTVRDDRGRVAFTWPAKAAVPNLAAPDADKKSPARLAVQRAFSTVFTDWHIGLTSRRNMPAQAARRGFLLNVSLAALLSAALLAGVVLALRTASREMKLSQMKSDFVSNVSHELRTPLASIRVFGEFLRLGRFDGTEKVREYGDYIETESRRLTQLINNLLDFASIESGRKSYRFERADLAEVIADTLKTFAVRLRQSGFRIIYSGPGPETTLPPVRVDPGAIAQALSNLLDNAVKYSNGGREIAVSLRREDGYLVLAVQDHGIGIPKDELKKIFDRFHRVSTGLVHDVKGSGLGLAIVRHVVEAHGGWVAVESRPGDGSTFAIHLPIDGLAIDGLAAGGGTAPRSATSEAAG